ncbi:MAG: EF-hand domain-containing protein [Planctomycetes bacterium]|nr:EF-hand domain-containing protein [Planctomycetota bacterium]
MRELVTKVFDLVERRYGGDFKKAFDSYDKSGDGAADEGEIKELLKAAGIGNWATRGAWASGIVEKMDKVGGNNNGKVEWEEFVRAIERAG